MSLGRGRERRMRFTASVSVALSLVFGASQGLADETVELSETLSSKAIELPPPPAGMERVRRLTDADYARKVEGTYPTGVPFVLFDRDAGLGYGARGYLYFNGDRSDPRFAYTPYLHRLSLLLLGSTNGVQYHWLDYDAPYLGGTLFRLRASVEYQANTAQNYFGVGESTLQPLATPDGATFASASAYDQRLHSLRPDDATDALYDRYFGRRPLGTIGVERSMLGGILRPFLGVGLSWMKIVDYTGTEATARDATGAEVAAIQRQTHLAADCASGRIVGCQGGWDNILRVGVSVDTRDFEPDPNSGIYAELVGEFGLRALGSDYQYARGMASVRGFYSPFPDKADLVLAARGVLIAHSDGVPFSSVNNIPFLDDNHTGLGGFRTLRGYRDNRFIGPVSTLVNLETRWTFTHFTLAKQQFAVGVAPFLDVGRVYDRVRNLTLRDWKRTQGLGLRVPWNEATVLMADYGFSSEDSGFYLNFAHIF